MIERETAAYHDTTGAQRQEPRSIINDTPEEIPQATRLRVFFSDPTGLSVSND